MDNRKLGWIAIALGVVALVVALGGRSRSMGWYNGGPQGGFGPRMMQQAPQGPQQWQAPQAPQAPQGPQQGFGPGDRFGYQQGGHGPRGFGNHHGFGGFFFFPLMMIGGLVRLALFALLIILVARWFFGRRRNQDTPPPPPGTTDPEQPPYTGGTKAL
jgi:hypothetical protein